MDPELLKIVIGCVIFGSANLTRIQLNNGTIFDKPEIVPLDDSTKFGIKGKDERDETSDCITVIYIKDVETAY